MQIIESVKANQRTLMDAMRYLASAAIDAQDELSHRLAGLVETGKYTIDSVTPMQTTRSVIMVSVTDAMPSGIYSLKRLTALYAQTSDNNGMTVFEFLIKLRDHELTDRQFVPQGWSGQVIFYEGISSIVLDETTAMNLLAELAIREST